MGMERWGDSMRDRMELDRWITRDPRAESEEEWEETEAQEAAIAAAGESTPANDAGASDYTAAPAVALLNAVRAAAPANGETTMGTQDALRRAVMDDAEKHTPGLSGVLEFYAGMSDEKFRDALAGVASHFYSDARLERDTENRKTTLRAAMRATALEEGVCDDDARALGLLP